MRYFVRPSALLVAFLWIAAPAQAGNLIVNGGFESPTVAVGTFKTYTGGQQIGSPGWTVEGKNVLLIQTTYAESYNHITGFNAQSGLNALDITGYGNTGPTDGVTQSVATDIGQSYLLTFYVGRADGGAGSVYATPSTVDLQINSGSLMAFTNSNATPNKVNWEQFSYEFNATSTSTQVTFLNGTASGNNYAGLDSVSMVATPEPSGLILMVCGSLGFASLVRRRFRNAR